MPVVLVAGSALERRGEEVDRGERGRRKREMREKREKEKRYLFSGFQNPNICSLRFYEIKFHFCVI